MRFWRDLRPAALAMAPLVAASLTLALGILLLASGASPSVPDRFIRLYEITPPLLIEVSHFLSSVAGLLLVMLAFGLRSKLDAAWAATMATLAIAAPLSLLKGYVWEEAVLLLVMLVALAPFRAAFPRKAALTRMEVTPGWLASALAAVVRAGLLGLWSFEHADYGNQSWWRVMIDADAARDARAWAGAAIGLLIFGVWRLVATAAAPPIVGEGDPDFARIRHILAHAEAAEPGANLALLGDKRFLFSTSGSSFLMFGVRGRSWVALGAPVGRQDERLDLLWRLRELADAHPARPGVYGAGVDELPDLVELGFSIQKVGENATVPLDSFQLEGTRRGNLRRAWKKIGSGGGSFEVIAAGEATSLMAELQAVSECWLGHHAGGEKGFSLGGFSPRYVAEFPVAVVRQDDKVVAFATLWTTSARLSFSMDLMRYSDDAPKNVMDFLFVELIGWGREQGYQAFEFGLAPLSGLDDRPLAPMMSRVGNLLFERGEEIYNFQGVHRYKDKYDPTWQPRYIAAPKSWHIPLLLAEVGLMSSGGMAGLAKRPKKEEGAV